jgi:hypothetical protein
MIILITIISFLLGFIINFIALPYILEYVVKDAWRYVRNISTLSVFRWSVSIIVSFALSALIIRNQQERIIKQTSSNYQCIVDSLNFEIKILQQYKVK